MTITPARELIADDRMLKPATIENSFRNVYPVLATLDSKLPRLLIVAIVLAHAAIALTFKVVFFSYGKPIGPADPLTNPLGNAADAIVSAAARALL